jgi:hypothetical protein
MNRNSIVANFAKNIESINAPINNMAANIANTIATNVNKTFNASFEANASLSTHTIYISILVIGVSIGILYLIKRYVIDENPALIQSWIDMFRSEQRRGTTAFDTSAASIQPPQPPAVVHPDTESWCFVGEDLTGRYCVKVPSAKSCEASRTYRSRQDCELVSAQHLPAGIITKNGAGMLPAPRIL